MTTTEPAEARSQPPEKPGAPRRLLSLDAVRGVAIVILLLAGNPFMREDLWVGFKHPEWHGLRFADLFFPLFLFVVGAAMTLSRRAAEPRHAFRRVGILFLLGVGLSSFKHASITIPGVLQHIAVAYLIAWLVLRAPRRAQIPLTAGIVLGVWGIYVAFGGSDPWDMTSTAAHRVDGFLFGHFATEGTLQSIISSVNVLGGAFIARGIKERKAERLWRWVGAHGAWLIALSLVLAFVVPVNKRVWSPSFALLSLGTSVLWFALMIWVIDVRRWRRGVTPLVELGANPIAIYVGYIVIRALLSDFAHLAPVIAPFGSRGAGALLYSLAWLVAGWLVARWLYRRRIFIKI
ncbi:MAG TPA: heparan-alpha-glucosaminide N-acetyltransferase domain-containing protein [Actinomycetota bacterium]|jgi:predicted acyltransferase|nr:heparan-alpha-glucosaminide N-acetyltransferase domain-containing protein [Actinomycetota bacterium]